MSDSNIAVVIERLMSERNWVRFVQQGDCYVQPKTNSQYSEQKRNMDYRARHHAQEK